MIFNYEKSAICAIQEFEPYPIVQVVNHENGDEGFQLVLPYDCTSFEIHSFNETYDENGLAEISSFKIERECWWD